jgi:TonB-linked SusC/RagA family outer membrane protein
MFKTKCRRLCHAMKMLLVIGFVLCSTIGFSQQKIISGRITDEDNIPLAGASVVSKGTGKGTSTDAEGRFSITANKGNILVLSNAGYKQQEVLVGNQTSIDIKLEVTNKDLGEVVVVGYGQQKKISVIGAISTIRTEEIKQSPAASLSVALTGRLPGLTVIQRSAEPGKDAIDLLIRGKGTYNSQAPLIIVDGIERSDFLNGLDPNEVEQVSILKDASATAVYGVRGANGVIIVTTRRGTTNGKTEINFSVEHALQNYTRIPQRTSSYDHAILSNELRANDGLAPVYTPYQLDRFRLQDMPELYPNINWYDLFIKKNTPQTRYNLNLRGGTKDFQYFVNAGYLSEDGLFKTNQTNYDANSVLKRYNFRANFDVKLNSTLKVSLQTGGYIEKQNSPWGQNGSNATTLIFNAANRSNAGRFTPLTPEVKDNAGNIVVPAGGVQFIPGDGGDFPIYGLLNRSGYNIEDRNQVTATFSLDQDLKTITKGLSVKALYAFDSRANNSQLRSSPYATWVKTLIPSVTTGLLDSAKYVKSGTDGALGAASAGTPRNITNATLQLSMNYVRSFGLHNITGLLLFNQEQKVIDLQLPFNYRGYVSRITYDYNRRYFSEVDLGYNGSEQFAPGKRFGFFPSFSAGWQVSSENWMANVKAVNSLKIRATYGLVGNDRQGSNRFIYQDNYSSVSVPYANLGNATRELQIGNKDVTWETAKKINVGIDATLFKNLSITLDLFREKRNNILTSLAGLLPNIQGNLGALAAQNSGVVTNKGVEVELSYKKRFNNGISLLARANVAYAKNNVDYFPEVPKDSSYAARYTRTGYQIGQPFGYVTDGFFNTQVEISKYAVYKITQPRPGDFKYVDKNGDGFINDKDQVAIGYPNEPLLNFGFAFSVSYKNFDLSGLLQGSANRSLYITGQGIFETVDATFAHQLDRWSPERLAAGLPINYPALTLNANPSRALNDFFLQDATFLRLKTTEIGYTFPKSLVEKFSKGVRIYVTGLNLFTWDKLRYKDYDPETFTNNNGAVHPIFKSYNFGINLTF